MAIRDLIAARHLRRLDYNQSSAFLHSAVDLYAPLNPVRMAQPSKKAAHNRAPKVVVSGAAGGTATAAGLRYQVNVILRQILRLCMECLSSPATDPSVQLEARHISVDGVTRWDVGFAATGELAEIKLNPVKQDLSDWIARARVHAGSADALQFLFVYGNLRGRRLVSLRHLVRIAAEAGTDQTKFEMLFELEDVGEMRSLLLELGNEPRKLLQRMKPIERGEASLSSEIDVYCEVLAGSRSKDFREFLFAYIWEGVPHRATINVRQLLDLVATRGIRLMPTPQTSLLGLTSEVSNTFLLLSVCPFPLPESVLASVVRVPAHALRTALSSPEIQHSIALDDEKWKLLPSPTRIPKADATLCDKALRALLVFISDHKYQLAGREQVRNAVALALACMHETPNETARMFISLDKAIKGIGDKFLVLKAAEMAISAAKRTNPRSTIEAQGEAHAMICGKSWALQRTGHLSEALIMAEKSLELGCAIGWDRNTPYCEKCIGRLYRLMAEAATDPTERATSFAKSIAHLQEAIRLFSNLSEFGPEHPEVGDCYSLLGRTRFSEGDRRSAAQMVQTASELIVEPHSKDYLDLLILRGQLAQAFDRSEAELLYSEVLEEEEAGDSERSEIVARAYFRRGVNYAAMGKAPEGRRDLKMAKQLWEALNETENSACAEWELFGLDGAIPKSAVAALSAVSVTVKVEVIRIHQERRKESSKLNRSRRAEPGSDYWKSLLKPAHAAAAVKSQQW